MPFPATATPCGPDGKEPHPSGFGALDVKGLFDEYAAGQADFNDQMIRELCRSRNLALVTDDADFGTQGIRVLTANRRLLGLP